MVPSLRTRRSSASSYGPVLREVCIIYPNNSLRSPMCAGTPAVPFVAGTLLSTERLAEQIPASPRVIILIIALLKTLPMWGAIWAVRRHSEVVNKKLIGGSIDGNLFYIRRGRYK